MSLNIEDKYGHQLIYPNPSKDMISININNNDPDVHIHNLQGQEVYNFTYTTDSGSINIDISALESGVYFVKIDNEKSKFIKE